MPNSTFVLELSEISQENISLVGGKGANLGEMIEAGFPVPPGFVISTSAYELFIEENNFQQKIDHILSTVNKQKLEEVQKASNEIKSLLEKGKFSKIVAQEITKRYKKMGGIFHHVPVAVRSSAVGESLQDTPFGGQQESYLNIQGDASVLTSIRKCWASLFSPQSILQNQKLSIAVVVEQMIEAEVSGIAFTSSPANKTNMIIEAIWGLGELITDGIVSPDRYIINRQTLEIVDVEHQSQEFELVKKGRDNKKIKIQKAKSKKQKLDEERIKELGEILQKIHTHYFFPQITEWAYKKGKFYILDTREITDIQEQTNVAAKEQEKLGTVFLQGEGASPGIVTGHVRIIHTDKDLTKLKKGEILVSTHISPDYTQYFKNIGGIITENGGITSHAVIAARELGITTIVNTKEAMTKIKDGDVITINGNEGWVVKGLKSNSVTQSINDSKKEIEPDKNIRTATKIYVNLGEPEEANEVSKLPVEGVGLLRAEFMLAQIGIHPKHLIKTGRQKILVDKLVSGLELFAKSFSPRPVVYRTSDFKTNEYRNLDGGKDFEPEEENPLLGFRGAFRYISDPQVFELELSAIKKVREKYKNLWVMVPFVRSPQELLEVKRIMASFGLMRSPSFKIWMMVELPINVILIEEFLNVGIDGVSIGTNDLTMLLTGTDRDNGEIASVINDLGPGVLWSIKRVIDAADKAGITSSICGQVVTNHDSIVQEVVNMGITSVSVNPDAVGRVQKIIYETERRVGTR